MKNVFKKIYRWFWRLSLVTVSVAFSLVFSSAVILQSLAMWLNTETGTSWLETRLQKELSGTGYSVEIRHFNLSSPFGMGVRSLLVKQGDMVVMDGKNVSISANILSLPVKSVGVSLQADRISLQNIPQSNETTNNNDKESFPLILPDTYFKKLVMDADIRNFSLSDQITEGGFNAHVNWTQAIEIQNQILDIESLIRLEKVESSAADYVPETVGYHMVLDSKTGKMDVKSINAENTKYKVEIGGSYNSVNNSFVTKVEAALKNSSGPLNVTAQLSGTPDKVEGTIESSGSVDGQNLSVKMPLSFDQNVLNLNGVTGEYGENPFSGSMSLSLPVADESPSSYVLQAKDWIYDEATIKSLTVKLDSEEDRSQLTIKGNGNAANPFTVTADIDIPKTKEVLTVINAVDIGLSGGKISASGQIYPDNIDVNLVMADIDLSKLPFAPLADTPRIMMKSGKVRLGGTLKTPTLQSELFWTGVVKPVSKFGIVTSLSYKEGITALDFETRGAGKNALRGKISIPMTVALSPFNLFVDDNTSLNGNAQGNIVLADIAPLLIPDTSLRLKGDMSVDARLSGTLTAPNIDGSVYIGNGNLFDTASNLELKKIIAKASFTRSSLTLQKLTAKDRHDGSLQAHGAISIEKSGLPSVDFEVKANSMNLSQGKMIEARLDADLSLKTRNDSFLLSGKITPQQVVVTLPDRFGDSIPKLNIVKPEQAGEPSLADKIKMDVLFDAKNRIFVRGWGLDTELGGSLKVKGTVAEPDIQGTLSTLRGRYEEFGKKFNIARADLRFQGTIPPSPYLDVLAETKAEDITAQILITGKAEQPKLALKSVPALPQDEILSRILFGTESSRISPFQAVQLAQSIRRLSGNSTGPAFDPLGTIRSVTGLDDITVDAENETVGAGKYISDKVYMELEQGKAEGSGAASVTVEITPHVSVESEARRNGSGGAGIFWGWDY